MSLTNIEAGYQDSIREERVHTITFTRRCLACNKHIGEYPKTWSGAMTAAEDFRKHLLETHTHVDREFYDHVLASQKEDITVVWDLTPWDTVATKQEAEVKRLTAERDVAIRERDTAIKERDEARKAAHQMKSQATNPKPDSDFDRVLQHRDQLQGYLNNIGKALEDVGRNSRAVPAAVRILGMGATIKTQNKALAEMQQNKILDAARIENLVKEREEEHQHAIEAIEQTKMHKAAMDALTKERSELQAALASMGARTPASVSEELNKLQEQIKYLNEKAESGNKRMIIAEGQRDEAWKAICDVHKRIAPILK